MCHQVISNYENCGHAFSKLHPCLAGALFASRCNTAIQKTTTIRHQCRLCAFIQKQNFRFSVELVGWWCAGTCPVTNRDPGNLTVWEHNNQADIAKIKSSMLETDGTIIENVDETSNAGLGTLLDFNLAYTLPARKKNKRLKVRFVVEIDEEIISEKGGLEWSEPHNENRDPERTTMHQVPGGPLVKYAALTRLQRAAFLHDRIATCEGNEELHIELQYFWQEAPKQLFKIGNLHKWCNEADGFTDPNDHLPGEVMGRHNLLSIWKFDDGDAPSGRKRRRR